MAADRALVVTRMAAPSSGATRLLDARADGLGGLLGAAQLVREAAEGTLDGEQLALRAALRDAAVLDHQDLVRAADRREAVRDDHRRAPPQEPVERVLDQHLGR